MSENPTPTPTPASGTKRRRTPLIVAACAVAALSAGWLSQFAVDGGDEKPAKPAASSESDSGNGNATVEDLPDDSAQSAGLLDLARREDGDPLAKGEEDAPVVMIEYADFGCSFCGKFARDTEPELVEEYVEAGVLRIEFRNFPVFGEDSERAALAAWAAGQQGRFWEFHETVYADPQAKEKGFSDERLTALAREAGVEDLARFDRDRAGDAARKALKRDQEEAYGLGATATPSFLVNDQPIAGAQPEQVFTDAVEKAEKKAKAATDG